MSKPQPPNPSGLVNQLMAAVNQLSDEQAGAQYRKILAQLPPAEAARLNTLALAQIAPEQRQVLAQGFKQAHADPKRPFNGYHADSDEAAASPEHLGQMAATAARQDPDLVNSLLGGENSGLGGQIAKAALAALLALLLRQLTEGQASGSAAQPAGGPAQGGIDMGSMLGSILGGLTSGTGQANPNQANQGGIDLGSMLGSILGGLTSGTGQANPNQASQGGIDLGSMLGSILGGGAESSDGKSYRKD